MDTFLIEALKIWSPGAIITRKQAIALADKHSMKWPFWLFNKSEYKAGRGEYVLPAIYPPEGAKERKEKTKKVFKKPTKLEAPITETMDMARVAPKLSVISEASAVGGESESMVPPIDHRYQKYGNYKDVLAIIESKMFYPIFITGLSGTGKTCMAEQVCANLTREFFRCNITAETDEDDLLGGQRLVRTPEGGAETAFFDGPVIKAMKAGGILLLDEVDLATNKIMCLQPVLEGKPILLKKINQWVYPKPGFNVIATANTKGKGSTNGVFIGTNTLNEAFLDRFDITIEHEYAPKNVERKILNSIFSSMNMEEESFVEVLIQWAESARENYKQDLVDEVISTRRLIGICKSYAIFRDKEKAISLSLARFDGDTKEALLGFYKAFAPAEDPKPEETTKIADPIQDDNNQLSQGLSF